MVISSLILLFDKIDYNKIEKVSRKNPDDLSFAMEGEKVKDTLQITAIYYYSLTLYMRF